MIVGMGAASGLSQAIPLAGKGARAFNSMSLGISGTYGHPLNRATTAVNSNLNQQRQDAAGRTFPSDQLRAGMNVQHTVNVFATAGLQITPKLGLGVTYVIMNSWTYTPKDVPICVALTGCTEPLRVNDPQHYRVSTWALASFDYDATDELSVSLGYYNQTNQIGLDGERRKPLWSPDARIFFTLTGNLDAIYRSPLLQTFAPANGVRQALTQELADRSHELHEVVARAVLQAQVHLRDRPGDDPFFRDHAK